MAIDFIQTGCGSPMEDPQKTNLGFSIATVGSMVGGGGRDLHIAVVRVGRLLWERGGRHLVP